jgi:beta-galactosidase
MNQKGVVERDGTKKEVFYVYQSYWTNSPMIHIYGHGWPVRWGNKDEEKLIKVYSNCEQVELFVNGKSLGTKKRNSQDYPAAGLHWTTSLLEGNNEVRAIGKKGKVTIEDTIRFQYQTEKWGKGTQLKLEKIKEENGIATVQVKLLDDKGVLCLDSANFIRFALTGDGKLVDNQGTSGGSRYVQLYNGRATIRIKLNGGHSVISVKSDGVETKLLNL